MIVDELKKSILTSAFVGKLTEQNSSESASKDLIEILKGKKEYLEKNKLKDNDKFLFDISDKIIPENWLWSSVGELCFVTKLAGFEYTKYLTTALSDVGEVPIVRAQNIKPNRFIDNCSEYIDMGLSKQLFRCALDCKCTLMTFIGAGIGEVAIFDKDKRYHLAPNVAKIVPGKDINKFLMYYFMSPIGKSNIFKYIKQTAQPSLSMETIRCVQVPLPPIEEQQRIVDKIEELFSKLDEIKPIEEELKQLKNKFPYEIKKSILKYFYDGNASLFHSENWKKNNLLDICNNEIYTGNSISENTKKAEYTGIEQGYNYIATKDLQFNHTFNYENGIKIPLDEEKFKYANKDDILMCIEGGSAGKKIGILEEKVCYGNKLCKFSPKLVEPKYLFYYLQSPQFLNNFNDNMTGIIGGVSINKIKKIEIKYPSLDEQKRIVDKIEQLLLLCNDIEQLVNK